MSKQTIFKDVLENKYRHEDFVLFTKEFLSGMELVAPDSPQCPPAHFAEYVKEYFVIGNYRGGRDFA